MKLTRRGLQMAVLVAACVAVLAQAPMRAPAAELDMKAPAARVNGKPITTAELAFECVARYGGETLQQMIMYAVVDEAATKRGIKVTPDEIAARLRALQARVDLQRPRTGVSFKQWLEARRLSLRELVAQARMELQLEKMVADKVKVTDQEVAAYYQANRAKFRQPERMLISHIAVEKKEEAERIRKEIVSGKMTFADAARKYSIDPYGRENGGLFGWIRRGNDPIQQAAFQLKKDGDISPVVKGKKGWEIIRRDAYQSERIPPFEELQDTVRRLLTADRTQRLARQMQTELMRAANIEVLIDFRALNEDMLAVIEAGRKAAEKAREAARSEGQQK